MHLIWYKMKNKPLHWNFLELWNGTGGTSKCAVKAHLKTGCPLDARYGWNCLLAEHRALVDLIMKVLSPDVVLAEPECTDWTISANTADKDQLEQRRQHQ